MARAGTKTAVGERDSAASIETRQRLVDAAIGSLVDVGFAGASAREIARRAGCNQGLVFYHFGTVGNLLLAALDETSRRRLERYQAAVADADGLLALVAVARRVFEEDLASGHIAVLAEMIAGSSSTPGLADEVVARVAPWREFAEASIGKAVGELGLGQLVPTAAAAHGIVALYLGLEMLAHLDGDQKPALDLFDHARTVAQLFAAIDKRSAP